MAKINSPHLLVIGGTGFIGHHLLNLANQRNWIITSVSLNPPSKDRFVNGVNYLNFDMTDLNSVKSFLNQDYDFVVNLGGYIDHKLFDKKGRIIIENHFSSIQNLIQVISRRKLKRFVHIGSSDEYGNTESPQNENLREKPISPYSLAKVASTHFLQMLYRTENFPAVILRLFLTYGPGQDKNRFIPQIINGCRNGNPFPTTYGKQIRDFCYVIDTVNAILKTRIIIV